MSNEKLIEYIDKRIEYFTGGEEMKSMREIYSDKSIVDELILIKNLLIIDIVKELGDYRRELIKMRYSSKKKVILFK